MRLFFAALCAQPAYELIITPSALIMLKRITRGGILTRLFCANQHGTYLTADNLLLSAPVRQFVDRTLPAAQRFPFCLTVLCSEPPPPHTLIQLTALLGSLNIIPYRIGPIASSTCLLTPGDSSLVKRTGQTLLVQAATFFIVLFASLTFFALLLSENTTSFKSQKMPPIQTKIYDPLFAAMVAKPPNMIVQKLSLRPLRIVAKSSTPAPLSLFMRRLQAVLNCPCRSTKGVTIHYATPPFYEQVITRPA